MAQSADGTTGTTTATTQAAPATAPATTAAEPAAPAPEVRTEDTEVLRRNYWVYRFFSALRLNPLGLFIDARASYRSRLYQSVDTIFRESYVAITPTITVTPAWVRLGAQAEIQPLAVLNLSAGYEFVGNYGTFNTIQSWNSPQARVSDREQAFGNANKWAYSTTGHQLNLGALFQVRLAGAIVIRSNAKLFYYAMNTRVPDGGTSAQDPMNATSNAAARRGDRVWYDAYYDILSPARGFVTHIDTDLLFSPEGPGLTIGLRHSFTQALFQKTDFAQGDVCAPGQMGMGGTCNEYLDPNGAMHRFGPVIAYNISESNHRRFNAPTIFVSVQWWLSHRYRNGGPTANEMLVNPVQASGDYINSAVPYFAAGFSFRGDLLFPRQ